MLLVSWSPTQSQALNSQAPHPQRTWLIQSLLAHRDIGVPIGEKMDVALLARGPAFKAVGGSPQEIPRVSALRLFGGFGAWGLRVLGLSGFRV